MRRNEVAAKVAEGAVVFGTYIQIPSPVVVEGIALSGLDFARFDPYHVAFGRETIQTMTNVAFAAGVTPWARIRNDPWEITTTLDAGVQLVTLPNVGSAAEARAAARAARYPPHGERENGRPVRMRDLSEAEYLAWAEREIWVSVQIEGASGVENYQEIVRTEGVQCIQTGRHDLASVLGLHGETMHPRVLEIEDRIIDAARSAGKCVSLHTDVSPAGFEYVQRRIEQGVQVFTLDVDLSVLARSYAHALAQVRPRAAAGPA